MSSTHYENEHKDNLIDHEKRREHKGRPKCLCHSLTNGSLNISFFTVLSCITLLLHTTHSFTLLHFTISCTLLTSTSSSTSSGSSSSKAGFGLCGQCTT